jgi:hypothetical protein
MIYTVSHLPSGRSYTSYLFKQNWSTLIMAQAFFILNIGLKDMLYLILDHKDQFFPKHGKRKQNLSFVHTYTRTPN